MKDKKNPLIQAIEKAGSIKVHDMPKEKQPKGTKAMAQPSDYYWPPTLYLSTEDFPGVENWKAGDVVNLAIRATISSKSENESTESKKRCSCELKITAISDLGGKK